MAAMNLEDWENQIRPWVRGAPHEIVQQVLVNVLREFCQFTRAWQYVPAAQTIADATPTYTLLLSAAYAEPVAVEWMSVDGGNSYMKPVEWLDEHIPTWRTRVTNDFTYYTQLTPRTVTFGAIPDGAGTTGGWQYRISQKPTMVATQTDDSLFNDWADEIADGVKANLMAMPASSDRPWVDAKGAVFHAGEYRRKKTAARVRVQKNYGNANQNWLPQYKFGGR